MSNIKPMKNKGHKCKWKEEYIKENRKKNKKQNRMVNPYKRDSVESRWYTLPYEKNLKS